MLIDADSEMRGQGTLVASMAALHLSQRTENGTLSNARLGGHLFWFVSLHKCAAEHHMYLVAVFRAVRRLQLASSFPIVLKLFWVVIVCPVDRRQTNSKGGGGGGGGD